MMSWNSGVCGWLGTGLPAEESRSVLARMTAGLSVRPGVIPHSASVAGGAVAVVGGGEGRDVHAGDGLVAATVGSPVWRRPELVEIARRDGNGAALAAAYRRSGRDLFRDIGGAFAIALVDVRRNIAVAAVDRLATSTMCYAPLPGGGLAFGSTVDAVREYPGVSRDLDSQALYDFLYFTVVPAPATIYRAQRKLLPAHYVWCEGGRLDVRQYWEMPYGAVGDKDIGSLSTRVRELVRSAVARATEGISPDRIGTFLSGGVDSSTVLGVLSGLVSEPVQAFSIGFDSEGYDEMEFARAAARHFGARHHEYYVTPQDVVDVVPKIAAAYDEPFGNSSAVPAYYCARLAREHGVELMLAGDGGDELFAGNARYARQKLFEFYGCIPGSIRRLVVEPLVFGIPGGGQMKLVRRARSYIEQARLPMPDRDATGNYYSGFAPDRIFAADIAREVDVSHPLGMLRDIYRNTPSTELLHRMLHVDMQITLGDDDLRKVVRTCAIADVDVRFPLLDDEVADFSARVPPGLALKGQQLRYFFKYAYRELLPESTLTKSKAGFGLPVAHWLHAYRPLEDLACDALSSLKGCGLFRPRFLDELMDAHRRADPNRYRAYFGEPIWVLTIFDNWMRSHGLTRVDAGRRESA